MVIMDLAYKKIICCGCDIEIQPREIVCRKQHLNKRAKYHTVKSNERIDLYCVECGIELVEDNPLPHHYHNEIRQGFLSGKNAKKIAAETQLRPESIKSYISGVINTPDVSDKHKHEMMIMKGNGASYAEIRAHLVKKGVQITHAQVTFLVKEQML